MKDLGLKIGIEKACFFAICFGFFQQLDIEFFSNYLCIGGRFVTISTSSAHIGTSNHLLRIAASNLQSLSLHMQTIVILDKSYTRGRGSGRNCDSRGTRDLPLPLSFMLGRTRVWRSLFATRWQDKSRFESFFEV